MKDEVVITPAHSGDADAITALVAEAYRPYIARIGREPAPMMVNYGDIVAAGLAMVARRGTELLGILVTKPQVDHLLLENVAVAASARGFGVGTKLLEAAECQARSLGLHEIRLYTNRLMTENLAYYPRHGYREVDRRVEDGFDRVHFVRQV
jgi:GNAT superfamily N-acetyltransferase